MSGRARYPAQAGFAAIAAIFLVVVLAAMGAFMVSFSNTAQLTSAQDQQGVRAYWAARGGLEWGLAQVTTNPATVCPAPASTTTSSSFTLDGFALTVSTTANCYLEGGVPVFLYRVQATASPAGTPAPVRGDLNFIERSVSATLEK